MKFFADTLTKCTPRLGLLKDVENNPNFELKTPTVMLYTRGGSIPHITHEVLQLITHTPQIIQIPFASTHHFQEALTEFPGNLSKFIGLNHCITCMSVQDPGDLTQPGHHIKDHIPLWTRSGKVLLNSECYMNAMETFRPDMYFFLSDGDTNAASSSKRISKSVDNTLAFFGQCLERHEKSEILKKSFVMACVAGGYDLKTREFCIEKISKNPEVQGFLIDGLHNNGPECEFIDFDEVKAVVNTVINKLPTEKLRVIHGCWNPVTILHLIQNGIDLFDTSYCHIVTERSSALTFSLDPSNESGVFEINLRQTRYMDDFQAILPGCSCLTCTKHSRGYIHHLVTVQELLGPLLLTIHNIHHYLKFFEKIRECIKNNTLNDLLRVVSKQFNEFKRESTKNKEDMNL